MTNGEKYKTAEERIEAHGEFCKRAMKGRVCEARDEKDCGKCAFAWLELEAEEEKPEEEKPMPCPFCGGRVELDYIRVNLHDQDFRLMCTKDDCLYSSGVGEDKSEAIAAHNHFCKAVAAYKERNGK